MVAQFFILPPTQPFAKPWMLFASYHKGKTIANVCQPTGDYFAEGHRDSLFTCRQNTICLLWGWAKLRRTLLGAVHEKLAAAN